MIHLHAALAVLSAVRFGALAVHLKLAFMHLGSPIATSLQLSGSSASFIQLPCMLTLVD